MFPVSPVLHNLARRSIYRARPILLFALVTLVIVIGPSIAPAQQLNLSWVDNSGGQASFIIQRAMGTSATYTQIAQVPVGVVSYTDTTALLGTSYCYRVAAVNSTGASAFSNLACGSPSGGFTLAVAKAGTGTGTVASSPAGIDCGIACSSSYQAGKLVTLTATPSSGSTFSGWSGGGCSGTDPCTMAGNGSVTVTATFAAAGAVAVNSVAPNQGTTGTALPVTINGSGFAAGATVSVSGAGVTGSNVTMVSATQLTATLTITGGAAPGNRDVAVTKSGSGAGTLAGAFTVVSAAAPVPSLTSISPATVGGGSAAFTLTATGSNFAGNSVVQVNGVARTTVFVSAAQLTATILASDIISAGALSIAVLTPAPGGGTSDPQTLTVTGPGITVTGPSIAVSATSSPPGGSITATLSNSPGGGTEWLVLALVGTPNISYLQWTYVGAGVTNRTWTPTLPNSGGPYEFRLFLNNGFTVAARSPAVSIANTNPVPVTGPRITVSATSSPPGGSITATLSNSPGGGTDWLALAQVGTPDASYFQWIYVGAGETNRTWTPMLPNSGGPYEFRLHLNDGYTVAARSPAVSVANTNPGPVTGPRITVSAPSSPPGGSITATLSNSPGGGTDWLALAQVGTPDKVYLQWTYVGAGVTNRTWVVNVGNTVATVGPYEFRLYLNNGDTVAARSPAVSVANTNPSSALTSLSSSGIAPGRGAFSLTVLHPGITVSMPVSLGLQAIMARLPNSPRNAPDWHRLATVGSPDTGQWTRVDTGVSNCKLKELRVYFHRFERLQQGRPIIAAFIQRYNQEWLVERSGHHTPARTRADAMWRAA